MVEVAQVGASGELVYNPYLLEVARDPHPIMRRLREEAPLYYNAELDFYALSRFSDVERAHVDRETFISGRGGTLDMLKGGFEIPPGTVIFEDPPAHTIHRALLSRMFTPRRIAELEPQVRALCTQILDPLVGSGGFDFLEDVGKELPMRVISMLVGIPEQDQEAIREYFDEHHKGEQDDTASVLAGGMFADYIDWRVEHPSDDIMTQLLQADFADETGATRRLTREELLAYVSIVAGAGDHTTRLTIGWMGKLLSDHPDQRRRLVEDRSLVPSAVEETLRFEPPPLQSARYVARDVEFYGQTVPEGASLALLLASANRDERRFADPDRYDVGRTDGTHLTLGFGSHFCLGQALARLEARVVLEEVLDRFPDWEVDEDRAEFVQYGADLRGWERLPVVLP
jgi:cytochrome P450